MTDWLTDWLTELTDWLTYWTNWLAKLTEHNSILAVATGLISSLFSVASSRDMPFCQPQQLQYLHHGSTKAHLCSPLYSIPFSISALVKICGMCVMASVWDT